MNAKLVVFSVGFLLLSACQGASAPGPGSASPASLAVSEAPPGSPSGPTASASCGEATVTLTDSCPAQATAGSACLAEAASACRAAEYVQTSQTDEGGTVVTRYRVQPEAGGCAVVLDSDWTRDPHGPAPRTRTRCKSADLAATASGCKVLHTIECGEDVAVR